MIAFFMQIFYCNSYPLYFHSLVSTSSLSGCYVVIHLGIKSNTNQIISNTNQIESNTNQMQTITEKRGRGRILGSKNKPVALVEKAELTLSKILKSLDNDLAQMNPSERMNAAINLISYLSITKKNNREKIN